MAVELIMLYAATKARGIGTIWATWRARRLLHAGAVVIDTETTDFDGEVIEIAVIDARTDSILLDSLVHPTGPINPEATRVHKITDQMCADAPTWPELWPQLAAVLADRPLVAFNAPFDQGRIAADCARHQLAAPQQRWTCLMRLDARHRRSNRWRTLAAAGLGGGHRAKDDAIAAARLLRQIAHHPKEQPIMDTPQKVTFRLSRNGQFIGEKRMDEDSAYALLDSLTIPGQVGQLIDTSGNVYIERCVYAHRDPIGPQEKGDR